MRTRGVVATAMLLASQQAVVASEQQWTAVTLARDGAVGQAVHDSRARAVALAIADCKRMRRWSDDCGSLLVTMQDGSVIAMLCGDYGILVTGRTLAEAEAGVARREARLRAKFGAAVPECVAVAIIGGGVSQ
jgi:hypothetical protein